jgi:hypothetical protein
MQRQVAQAGVLGGADPVLAAGAQPVAQFEAVEPCQGSMTALSSADPGRPMD